MPMTPSGLPSPPYSTEGKPSIAKTIEERPVHQPTAAVDALSNKMDHIKMQDAYSTPPPTTYDPNAGYFTPASDYRSATPTSYPRTMPPQEIQPHPAMMEGHLDHNTKESSPSIWHPSNHGPPSLRAKVGKSAIQKRKCPKRGTKRRGGSGVTLTAPISQLTAYLAHIPIKDMETVAKRSPEERQKEIKTRRKEPKDPKRIPRPMNCFMMYRSAFADRIKAHLQLPNHQTISAIAGASWRLETPDIRTKYESLANLERENHAAAHPGYKFQPHKGPAATKRISSPPASDVSGHMTDTGSPAWDDDYVRVPHMPQNYRSTSYDFEYANSSRGSTPFTDVGAYVGPHGPYFPGYPTPTQPASISTVEPNVLHGIGASVHGLPFPHGSPAPSDMQYGSSSGLAGLPGGTHVDLLQPQPAHPNASHISNNGHVDPNLLFNSGNSSALRNDPMYPEIPHWDDEPSGCYMATPVSQDASSPATFHHSQTPAGYLPMMQRESSWDPSQPGSSFMSDDAWLSEAHTPASSGF